jgi:peptidoglycan/LPS O-acetylase OafA/YrhL
MTSIGDLTQGKDNNLKLIRIIAALTVLLSHSFALSKGTPDAEPLRLYLGMTLGDISVDIFFITSGFLITKSLICRANIIDFIWARILRVLPALAVMLLLTVLGMGIYFTKVPILEYLRHPDTWMYVFKNTSLLTGAEFTLPGVFQDNPIPDIVNGSLWTLPFEVSMYVIVAVLWIVLYISKSNSHFKGAILIFALLAISVKFMAFFLDIKSEFFRLFYMFFVGGAFYVLRDYILLSKRYFWVAFIGLFISTFEQNTFFLVYNLLLAYMLFYIAFVPAGVIRKYNAVGDYSYGIYIYAFPVQQTVAVLFPGISPGGMVVWSLAITLPLAILSWNFIEQQALECQPYFAKTTRSWLGKAGLASP